VRKILLLFMGLLILIPSVSASAQVQNSVISSRGLTLQIKSIFLNEIQVRGEGSTRGAALAILANGDYLLGGGANGNQIFRYQPRNEKLENIGEVYSVTLRRNDARFAITDLQPLFENEREAKVLVSYPRLGSNQNCVQLQVDLIKINLINGSLENIETWFVTDPCVPINAVQHAAGKLEQIDSTSAYLTVGDFGFTRINNRRVSGDLSTIFKINKDGAEKISTGHRNAQGILLYRDKYLLASEHGPRGGDELNIIKSDTDYGWPFVTWGAAYSAGDYVVPRRSNSHDGYQKPIMYWTPSIAPTDLIQLPLNSNWKRWSGQILMGTLREQSLVRIYLDNDLRPTAQDFINVNERIRGLEISQNGIVVATTDSGRILEIKPL
jgi:glucose/arabinose dehydrogenase